MQKRVCLNAAFLLRYIQINCQDILPFQKQFFSEKRKHVFMPHTSVEKKVGFIRDYLSQRPDIVMAFIFGSYARGTAITESDFDIAIYFKPAGRGIEWEEEIFYKEEDAIWGTIEKIIGIRTDLVILNRAPSILAYSIIQDGTPLIIKDPALYLRFFLTISSAAEYFSQFTQDFWVIKQRSASLTAIDKERLIRITDFLETELQDYSQFVHITQKEYETHASIRRNTERWVENIVNASIDIAKILIASEKKHIPQTYRQILDELTLLENFDPDTACKLAQFSKLRNILAHEYLDIRFNHIKQFIEQGVSPYTTLVAFVKSLIH